MQQPHRGASGGTDALDQPAGAVEVSRPFILSRVEQPADLTGIRIEAGKVRTLALITVAAGEREIFKYRWPAVLPGKDVLDVK